MKTRTLLSTALIAIVALAIAVPALGQSPASAGLTIRWQIVLRATNTADWATAEYTFQESPSSKHVAKFAKFTVEAVTPGLPDGTKLAVFVGPGTSPDKPYGRQVGTISVERGTGAMVMYGTAVPKVQKGTTVAVLYDRVPGEPIALKGKF